MNNAIDSKIRLSFDTTFADIPVQSAFWLGETGQAGWKVSDTAAELITGKNEIGEFVWQWRRVKADRKVTGGIVLD